MPDRINIDGIEALITQSNYGQGGQGFVHLGVWSDDADIKLIAKYMPALGDAWDRTTALCDFNLSGISPGFAAPLACEMGSNGELVHLAPFADGVDIENDIPRNLPQNLEIALELCCLIAMLEDHDLAHGDIAPSNVLIAPDGTVSLIDFDGFVSRDPAVPAPATIGQRPMLAPELRAGTGVSPSIESDRFALGVYLSWFLSGRYPTDGLSEIPAEIDQYMMQGDWPERHRSPEPDEVPIEALGAELTALFDLAFSLDPMARPSAETWRVALTSALNNCWIHDCGQAFVGDEKTTACPWCQQPVKIAATEAQLKITINDTGQRFGVVLTDRKPIVLGRSTLPGLPGTVSSRQLEITPFGDRLLLRHVGRHDTLIKFKGDWYRLDQHWVKCDVLRSNKVEFLLAGSAISLALE